jgi:hypothetical protein
LMSELTGAQKASLIDALLSGYTSDEQLAELLALRLDINLAEIAPDGTLREQTFAVVTWAEAHGRTRDLALHAQAFNPRNPKLAAVVDALYPGERQPLSDEEGDRDSGRRQSPLEKSGRRGWILGAVAIAAILIAIVAINWRSRGGGGDAGGNGGGKDRPRLPATLRFTSVTAITTAQTPPRVVVDARFSPPQLSPGALLWFVIGSGPRCGKRIDKAQVDNPSLGYMTFILAAERERVTCAQLFVEDANGQTIARSDPHDIKYQGR